MKPKTKQILLHLGIVLMCLAVSCIYFSPLLGGKALPQGDIQSYEGMAKAQKDYHAATGDYTTWAPNMFSGMPGYQITNSPQHSLFWPLRQATSLSFMGRGNDIGVLFLYLLGFYLALVTLGLSPWLSLLGALAFGLGSYNIIIIEAGHITKAWAIAMMAPILAGMLLAFKRKYVWGGILFFFALGLQIQFNHIQITFYTVIAAVVLGLTYLIYALKDKQLKPFFMAVGALLVGAVLAFGCNLRHLMINQEYAKYTMRGGKEITVTPKDLNPDDDFVDSQTNDKGLQVDYAFMWSYGVGETYTLLVPGAMGGGSGERMSEESEFYKATHQNIAPLYWGDQPFTSGPVYFGAIICFLFVLGLFVVKGPERWWILVVTLIGIVMSWGRNCMPVNEWLFNHLPLYNKFRTPSMSLVMANVAMVLMAMLALKEVMEKRLDRKKLNLALYCSAGITVAILLVGMVVAGSLSFSGGSDLRYEQQMGAQQWAVFGDILQKDRHSLFVSDSWRSLLLILAAAAMLWLFANEKVKRPAILLAVMAVLVVGDLWGVDHRYLSEENYVNSERQLQLYPSQTDNDITAMAAMYGDQNFRVMNLTVNTFNDSRCAAFHQQIGGYSAAKLRRYQDLIDFYLGDAVLEHYRKDPSRGFDDYPVLDMLNCRYMVLPAQSGVPIMRRNSALGNAWFVQEVQVVEDANAEILALNDFDPARTAIVHRDYASMVEGLRADSASRSTITMVQEQPRNPSHCLYQAHCEKDELALFSEIHYAPDWRAYIDGEPVEYLRADYVLRALVIPAGDHTVEFRNEAPMMHKLDNWTLIISIFSLLLVVGVLMLHYRRKSTETL